MLGRKIGHYQITRMIGRGGMGQVYEAVHEEIERRAAIKLLLPQYTSDPEAATRFLNELRAPNTPSPARRFSRPGTAAKRASGAAETAGPPAGRG